MRKLVAWIIDQHSTVSSFQHICIAKCLLCDHFIQETTQLKSTSRKSTIDLPRYALLLYKMGNSEFLDTC